MYALYLVGPIVERLYGPVRFVGFYVVAAIFGSLATFAFGDAPLGTGASGAIFGLFGVLFVATRLHLPVLDRASRNIAGQIGILILINIGFGLSTGIVDNMAHIGGLIAGVLLAVAFAPGKVPTLRSMWQPGSSGQLAAGNILATPVARVVAVGAPDRPDGGVLRHRLQRLEQRPAAALRPARRDRAARARRRRLRRRRVAGPCAGGAADATGGATTRRRDRQDDADAGAVRREVLGDRRPAVGPGELADDREAQARPAAGPRGVAAIEPLERPIGRARREARAVVHDREGDRVAGRRRPRPGRRVASSRT